jgi:glycosyltransferase involved in cell wall biosynthesis
MKNILWLCSWYPNEVDKFRGDFVQRQAIAASQYCKIDVVHVLFCDENNATVTTVNENLKEHIFYVKKKNKVLDFLFFYFIHQKIRSQFKNKIDLVHVQVTMNAGIMALIWKKIYNIPYVITEHYGIYNHILPDNYSTRSFFYKQWLKAIFKNAQKILSVSEFIAKNIQQEVCSILYAVIPNVVNTDLFFYQAKAPHRNFRFIHISNLSENKHVRGILNAFEKLAVENNNIELIIVGGDATQFEKLIQHYPKIQNNIVYKGELNYQDVSVEIQLSDCFILNSLIENSPCVIIESLCCGIPIIATNVGGIPELINKENGILINSNDDDNLYRSMKKMIDNYLIYNLELIALEAKKKYGYKAVGGMIKDEYIKLI